MVFQHFNLFDHLTAVENIMEAPVRVYGEDEPRLACARQGGLAGSFVHRAKHVGGNGFC
jgi:ABC-type histidine transport system ATPase subunit